MESDLTEVNIGPNTRPETFIMNNNLWYNEASSAWLPNLPVQDLDQLITDPQFVDESNDNFRLSAFSPAIAKGKILDALDLDFDMLTYNVPPSIGAFEGGEITSSVQESESMEDVHIYPNPANRQAQIQLDLEDDDLLVMLYDMSGKLILNQNSTTKFIDLAELDLQAGQYIVKAVSNEGKTYAGKLFLY